MYYIFREATWPSIRAAVNYMQKERKKPVSVDVRAGINFSIIVGAACYLEGILETGLKAFLSHRRTLYNRLEARNLDVRRSMNLFYNRIDEDIERRISSATGAKGYDEMFELLIGSRLSKLPKVAPLWEGLTVLFQLRNVLGHGREVFALQNVSTTPIEEFFSGGYRCAEDYLVKQKLSTQRFTEAHSDYVFLSNAVADHFWKIAKSVPTAVSNSLPNEYQRQFDKALRLVRAKERAKTAAKALELERWRSSTPKARSAQA